MTKVMTEEGFEVEVYEDAPDHRYAEGVEGAQDFEDEFRTLVSPTTRDTQGALDWYKRNQTTSQIGFNPDGMCLKICRVARNIPARYASAREAMLATPQEDRRSLVQARPGMVAYYADPRDGNPYDHVATIVGRVKGGSLNRLSDLLVETNSVKRGEIVTVRGDYFPKYWGDPFTFAAVSLNGYDFPDFVKKEQPKPLAGKGESIRSAMKQLKAAAQYHKRKKNDDLAEELKQHEAAIRATYKKYGGK